MTDAREPERPTFREWLEANNIQQELTPEQWDAMMERDRIDMDMRFMTVSVIDPDCGDFGVSCDYEPLDCCVCGQEWPCEERQKRDAEKAVARPA